MIPIAMPLLAEEMAEAARATLLLSWVSQDPEVTDFEREFAAVIGAALDCAAPAQGHHPGEIATRAG